MKFLLRFVAFLFLMTCVAFALKAQNTSSKGTEFWTGYMLHQGGANGFPGASGTSQMALYITSDISTSGVVECADKSFSIPYTVTANQTTIVDIPATAFLNTFGTFNKGIHITALKPVAVYGHIYASAVSGATLILPVNTLGINYQSINYTQAPTNTGTNRNFYSTLMVIAIEDNTTVQITPTTDLASGEKAGIAFTITLNAGQVYQGLAAADLTGTSVKSISANGAGCRRIAVYSGSSRLYISCNLGQTSSDNLFQQTYPLSTWGKNFISAPLSTRAYDIFRVVVSDPSAVVTLNGMRLTGLVSNSYYEFKSTTTNVISSDKPIQAVQYAVTSRQRPDCTLGPVNEPGDPEMIYLIPIEQGLDHVTLYSTPRYNIQNNSFINVIIPNTAVSSFKLDGQPYTNFNQVPLSNTYSYAQISVNAGTHNIAANDIFNAIAYGFAYPESYGYAAGTNLKNLNEFVALQDSASNNYIVTNGCSNLAYTPRLKLPYRVSKITWNIDGTTVVQTTKLNEVVNVSDVPVTYSYTYYNATKNSSTINFAAGTHTTVATVFNPNGDCGNNEDVDPGPINIVDAPQPTFTVSTSCAGQGTLFTITNPTDTTGIVSYSGDFGDGSPLSTDRNPVHVYTKPGDYKAVLTINYAGGCTNVSAPVTIHVSPKPVASFTFSSPDCATKAIAFTDASTDPEKNKIVTWSWNFGDGITSADQNPTHIFATDSTYQVKLVVTDDKGCQSDTVTNALIVHPTPIADFTAPDICLQDGNEQFTNTSDFKGDDPTGFTYAWDFGDKYATAVNNKSNSPNPVHRFSQAGTYTVTLYITSPYNCVSSVTSKQIIVNASTPAAAFTVLNPTGLCAASPVVFQDKSTKSTDDVITKVVWHWGDGTADSTYDKNTIHTDGLYNHSYPFKPTPNSPTQKQYTVTLDEYTGLTCVNSTFQTITVNANPVVKLSSAPGICQEAQPFQIVETTAFLGNGVFTGTGVSSKGVFDPYKAGPGSYTINYLFTANNTGCTYSDSVRITVNPTPIVTLGPDFKMLEGDTTTLIAKAVGDSLSYKWYPSAGLNHDNVLNPVAKPTDDTKYTLTVTSAKGCSSAASVFITVLKLPKIPNTFTPNGDGVNDVWHIDQLDKYVDATVDVYNRNGDKVYSSKGYSIPWDGKYQGADLPVGVYYYIINPKERRKVMSGYVTIIR